MRAFMLLTIVTAIASATMLLGGCREEVQQPPVKQGGATLTLGEKDSGRKLQIAPGQRVIIRLEGNITTGYTWSLVGATDDAILKNLGATFAPGSTAVAGSSGTQSWSFEGIAAGDQEVRFDYRRPWERDSPPAKTVSYAITVR